MVASNLSRGRRVGELALVLALATGASWLSEAPRPTLVEGRGMLPAAPQAQLNSTGRLLFTQDGGLSVLRLGEAQTAQVLPRPRVGMILSARWAPDGSRVAYAQYEVPPSGAPSSAIYVAGADGRDPQVLVASEQPATYYQAPAWGPGGRQLYFLHAGGSLTDPIRRIERLEVATGVRTPVTDEPGQFDISPDGRWLALAHAPGGRPALAVVDLQAGTRTTLIPVGGFEVISSPRFDPASQNILFSGLTWGSIGQKQAPEGRGAREAFFRPAVAQAHGPPADLYTIPVAGGPPHRLTNLLLDDPVGAWAPDASQLAILAAEYLAVMPLNATEPTPIMTPGAYGSIDWAR